MIKALSLAAALALLPLSAAVAHDLRGPSDDALEAAAEAFEVRMEAFGERAKAIAAEALAEIDIDAVVAQALAEVDVDAVVGNAVAQARGIATKGAWASRDPEHMATYGIMADYALGAAMDSPGDAEVAETAEAPQAPVADDED
ncbi:hypothetical protein [Brevundimonas sp.]|uniref:hypothetical protein n=1 Tax=Brevundimonas sp. TaxID=1871086 RepID=UPI0035696FCD